MAESWSAVPEWIGKGNADWEAVEILHGTSRETQRDTIVYHAQQCAEKLLKARLIQLGQRVRKTHDLTELSSLLHKADPSWNWDAFELERLSNAGVLHSYPGFETSREEMQELITIAGRLRQVLLQHLVTGDQAPLP